MSSHLDPYTVLAEQTDVTPRQKINDLIDIVKASQTGMLTTRSPDGSLHSRAMTPCSPHESCLTLYFLANNASHKFDEIKNDTHCNVNFFNTKTTSWASYSGKAKIIEDRALIKANWSPFVSAYFGDLKDGVHKGDENDPRVSLIEVVPDEIRYWVATRDAVGRAFEEGLGALTGKVSAPGELRTITKSDMQLAEGLHK